MRRMLDPTTLGGGGAKIYRHCISFSQNTEKDKLRAYLTYYTTSQTKFDVFALRDILPNGKTYECSGYYEGQSGKGPITNLEGKSGFPAIMFRNILLSDFTFTSILLGDYTIKIADDVSEVN